MKFDDFSNDLPSVTFDFRKSKYLDPRISFTRASFAPASDPESGTGMAGETLNMFNVNVPRLTDKGLLIEEARTNSEPHSQGFTSGWNLSYAQTTTGQSDPMGGTNAILVKQTDGTSTRQFISAVTAQNFGSNAYTVSVYVKYVNYDFVIFTGTDEDSGPSGNRIGYLLPKLRFQFSTKVISFQESTWGGKETLGYGFEECPNGWYRLWMTISKSARFNRWGISVQSNYAVGSSDLDFVTGDNSSSVLAFGFQVEQGGSPTSYIPTSGSTATRAADVCTITGDNFSSWYSQGQGTIVVDSFEFNNADVFNFSDGSNNNRIINSTTGYEFLVVSAGTESARFNVGGTPVNENMKLAGAYQTSNFGFALDGTAQAPVTSGNAPTGINQLSFHRNWQNANIQSGYLKSFTYYPTRLPDAALVALTNNE